LPTLGYSLVLLGGDGTNLRLGVLPVEKGRGERAGVHPDVCVAISFLMHFANRNETLDRPKHQLEPDIAGRAIGRESCERLGDARRFRGAQRGGGQATSL